ncbi:hypothetical protein BD779DRAFT_1787158, partial [Infundibulicybe gibba]
MVPGRCEPTRGYPPNPHKYGELLPDLRDVHMGVRVFIQMIYAEALTFRFQTQWETCMSTGDSCELSWQNPHQPGGVQSTRDVLTGKRSQLLNHFQIDVRGPSDAVPAFKFTKKTLGSKFICILGMHYPQWLELRWLLT